MNRNDEAARRPESGSTSRIHLPAQRTAPSHRADEPAAGGPDPTRPNPGGESAALDNRVTLRGPGELADALPYLLGYYPDDSIVLVALQGARHRVGGRVRTAIPEDTGTWRQTAAEVATCLVEGSASRDRRPDAMVLYLCQEPRAGEQPRDVLERLRPLAQYMRTTCGAHDIPVLEALCVSGGRYFSYCCPDTACCPTEGRELRTEPASPIAAAATYAGVRVQGSLRDLEQRVTPLGDPVAGRQIQAFDLAARALVPKMLGNPAEIAEVRAETLRTAERLMTRYRRGGLSQGGPEAADLRDDALLTSHEAALLVLGLQDRVTRDRAAQWMEGPSARAALRLWRALARRCVRAYEGHAPAPLTLAGWVAWSLGEDAAARVAIGRALESDPGYTFARLLHQAINDGMDPEPLRRCLRRRRETRTP
ncbi:MULTISPECIES: DUF4192 domain-containing protein [unclassified Streptomyces]|uniref:DUF4192 domain-containing protein n=1 Tax=unclassified Streptomyces TaxID=2593676 RepID=UPI000CD4F283|nr:MULTISPECIES: DUF4192 domain-containing protein [unclassified Streptomyces]